MHWRQEVNWTGDDGEFNPPRGDQCHIYCTSADLALSSNDSLVSRDDLVGARNGLHFQRVFASSDMDVDAGTVVRSSPVQSNSTVQSSIVQYTEVVQSSIRSSTVQFSTVPNSTVPEMIDL